MTHDVGMTDDTSRDLLDIKWLTVAEVALKIRQSKMTVYRLIKVGELRAHRFGRGYRVAEDDFRTYVRKSMQTVNPE